MGQMDYMSGPDGNVPGNEWNSPPFFMDGQQQGLKPPGPLPPLMGPQGNGRPGKGGGGSIPSPATPSSSCGGPPRYAFSKTLKQIVSYI
jgi:hypothetical protein